MWNKPKRKFCSFTLCQVTKTILVDKLSETLSESGVAATCKPLISNEWATTLLVLDGFNRNGIKQSINHL